MSDILDEDFPEVEDEILNDGDIIEELEAEETNQENQNEEEKNDDKEKKTAKPKKVVRNPRVTLNTERLKGPKGLGAIDKCFENVRFKGKGYEEQDLNVLLKTYEYWCHRLFPKLPFVDCIEKIERLGSKGPIQTHLKKVRSGMIEPDLLTSDEILPEIGSDDEGAHSRTMLEPNNQSIIRDIPVELTEEQLETIRRNREKAEKLRLERLKKIQEKSALNLPTSNNHVQPSTSGIENNIVPSSSTTNQALDSASESDEEIVTNLKKQKLRVDDSDDSEYEDPSRENIQISGVTSNTDLGNKMNVSNGNCTSDSEKDREKKKQTTEESNMEEMDVSNDSLEEENRIELSRRINKQNEEVEIDPNNIKSKLHKTTNMKYASDSDQYQEESQAKAVSSEEIRVKKAEGITMLAESSQSEDMDVDIDFLGMENHLQVSGKSNGSEYGREHPLEAEMEHVNPDNSTDTTNILIHDEEANKENESIKTNSVRILADDVLDKVITVVSSEENIVVDSTDKNFE